jgi:hypothetical protein
MCETRRETTSETREEEEECENVKEEARREGRMTENDEVGVMFYGFMCFCDLLINLSAVSAAQLSLAFASVFTFYAFYVLSLS